VFTGDNCVFFAPGARNYHFYEAKEEQPGLLSYFLPGGEMPEKQMIVKWMISFLHFFQVHSVS
jgi:hypothetical protein